MTLAGTDRIRLTKLAAYYARCVPGLQRAQAERVASAVIDGVANAVDVTWAIEFARKAKSPAEYFMSAVRDAVEWDGGNWPGP